MKKVVATLQPFTRTGHACCGFSLFFIFSLVWDLFSVVGSGSNDA